MNLYYPGPQDLPSVSQPDAHGEAALLIVESMLHTLVEQSIFSVEDAVGTLQTAIEVKTEAGSDGGESRERMHTSLNLMFRILDSVATDLRSDRARRSKSA